MTGILGLVGSARRWGNSELLVRQVLQGAQAEGALVRMVRLTDLRLEPCTGCMRCVMGGRPCSLDDDMDWLIEVVEAADGLVLAAPTYFLGPAAVSKLVLDRLLMVTGRVDRELTLRGPAITVATAGLEGWRGVTLPYLNALVAAFGYRPIERLTAIAPGPGEVLLNEGLMARLLAAGRRLGRGEMQPSPAPQNACPTCCCDAFVLHGIRAVCPICGQEATLELDGGGIQFRFDSQDAGQSAAGGYHRWTPEGLRAHMTDWVMATGPRFLAHRAEIKARRKAYREEEVGWLWPASREAG
jgi:multimeric flavodoxin WrbA